MAFKPPTLSSPLSRTTPESRAQRAKMHGVQRSMFAGVKLKGDDSPLKYTHNDRIPHKCDEKWKKRLRKGELPKLDASGDPIKYPRVVHRASKLMYGYRKKDGKRICINGRFAKKLTPEELKAYFAGLPRTQQ